MLQTPKGTSKTILKAFRRGGADSAPPMTFLNVAPRKIVKCGVMGYENLCYCIGKTPKKVLGPKFFLGPVRKPSKSDQRKI